MYLAVGSIASVARVAGAVERAAKVVAVRVLVAVVPRRIRAFVDVCKDANGIKRVSTFG